MQFSTRLPVAVHILLCIREFEGRCKTTSNFLAGSVGVNPVIVRNTLGKLKAAGLVQVEAGVGGASLLKEPTEITLLDVFHAVEDEESLFRFHENPNPDCPVGRYVHSVLDGQLRAVDDAMKAQLRAVTLQDLLNEMEQRIAASENKDTDKRR